MLKIKVNDNFRNLKKGDEFTFSNFPLLVVGPNGSGKTSLTLALRGNKSDKKEKSLIKDLKMYKDFIDVESHYEKFIFYNAVEDNGTDFRNAFDGSNFIESGGYHTSRISHGQASMMMLNKIINRIKNEVIPGKTLVVFDEIDSGWDITTQNKLFNIGVNLKEMLGADCLIFSHSLVAMIDFGEVYDFENRSIVDSSDYIKKVTNLKI